MEICVDQMSQGTRRNPAITAGNEQRPRTFFCPAPIPFSSFPKIRPQGGLRRLRQGHDMYFTAFSTKPDRVLSEVDIPQL